MVYFYLEGNLFNLKQIKEWDIEKVMIFSNLVVDNSYSNISEVSTASKFHEVELDLDVSLNSEGLPFKH